MEKKSAIDDYAYKKRGEGRGARRVIIGSCVRRALSGTTRDRSARLSLSQASRSLLAAPAAAMAQLRRRRGARQRRLERRARAEAGAVAAAGPRYNVARPPHPMQSRVRSGVGARSAPNGRLHPRAASQPPIATCRYPQARHPEVAAADAGSEAWDAVPGQQPDHRARAAAAAGMSSTHQERGQRRPCGGSSCRSALL